MKIETMEDKVLAEGIDNNIIRSLNCAREALEHIHKVRYYMGEIPLDIPNELDKTANEIISDIDALEKKIRKATRDWSAESLKYEDAIKEYEIANNREGGRRLVS